MSETSEHYVRDMACLVRITQQQVNNTLRTPVGYVQPTRTSTCNCLPDPAVSGHPGRRQSQGKTPAEPSKSVLHEGPLGCFPGLALTQGNAAMMVG